MSGIFVSYRRSGASVVTYRLVDELKRCFGEQTIFLDVESIDPGLPFAESIQGSLAKCSIVLVVIGPNWLSMSDEAGGRRIDDPEDWIHQEVKMAMAARVRVIPVLVQGATMPEKRDLPEPISALAALQAFTLSESQAHWAFDVNRLVTKLRSIDSRLPKAQDDDSNLKIDKPAFSKKIIAAWVVLILIEITAISEGWADGDEILGAMLFLIGSLVLGVFGFQDILKNRATGKISAIAVMVISGLAATGHGINYALYDEFGGSGFLQTPAPAYNPYGVTQPQSNALQQQPAQPQIPSVAGSWMTPEGVTYQFTQSGSNIAFVEFNAFGAQVGQGEGNLSGRQVHFSYHNSFVGMSTNGVAQIGNGTMTITLTNPATGQPFTYQVYKQ